MDKRTAFQILEIEETKDLDRIRDAYRARLRVTNPEDDAQGFMRLRSAYDAAVAWAQIVEEEFPEEKNEYERWIDRVDEGYKNLESRRSMDAWVDLFADPLCVDSDTVSEVRDYFLTWLMDHFFLPKEVWKLADLMFSIEEDRWYLEDEYPEDFLDYIVRQIHEGPPIRFDAFRVLDEDALEPEPDVDGYIRSYLKIRQSLGGLEDPTEEQIASHTDDLHALSAFGVWHPYEDVERLRLDCMSLSLERPGENSAALRARITERADVLSVQYADDPYVLLFCGRAYRACGKHTLAAEKWETLLTLDPNHRAAKYDLACFYEECGEYGHAKTLLMAVADAEPGNTDVSDLLHRVNVARIKQLEERRSEGSRDEEGFADAMELAWCYYHANDGAAALRILETLTPNEAQEPDYFGLYGRTLFLNRQFQAAIDPLTRFLERFDALEASAVEQEESSPNTAGRSHAYYCLSVCWFFRKDMMKAFGYAERAAETAEGRTDWLAATHHMANLYFEQQQYERCVHTCSKVLQSYPDYIPSYLLQIEAAAILERHWMVVEGYQEIRSLEPRHTYARSYLLAAESYYEMKSYRNVLRVLESAETNQVPFTNRMWLAKAKALRRLAGNEEERLAVMEILNALAERVDTLDSDLKDASEVDYERAYVSVNLGRMEDAKNYIYAALRRNREPIQYHWLMATVYSATDRDADAIQEFHLCREAFVNQPIYYYCCGKCYDRLGQKETAAEYYEKALALEDGYDDTLMLLAEYHMERYLEKNDEADYEKAIGYASHQIELHPSELQWYRKRGRLYDDAGRFREAIADYDTFLDQRSDHWVTWHNKGHSHMMLREFEQAIICYENACRLQTDRNAANISNNYMPLCYCYQTVGLYGKAIDCLETIMEVSPDTSVLEVETAKVYVALKDYRKALSYLKKSPHGLNIHEVVARIQLLQGHERRALLTITKGYLLSLVAHPDRGFELLGWYCLECMRNYDRALRYYTKAFTYQTDKMRRFELQWKIARICYLMGRYDLAKQEAGLAVETFQALGIGTVQQYLAFPPEQAPRRIAFGWIHICLGETEAGLRLFEEMPTCAKCVTCSSGACYESAQHLASYYEHEGQYEKALALYEKAYAINDHCVEVVIGLREVRKRLQ